MQDFTVPVAHLLGHPGEHKDIEASGALPGVGTSLAHVTEEPVKATLRLESVVEGILVTGEVHAQALIECSRCLERMISGVDMRVVELFVAPGHEEAADEDAYRISGSEIELEPMIRDAIGLDLPLNPLCDESCKGLCPRCGHNLNAEACTCVEDEVDPRWAPLADLRERLASES